jgi:hypothetical protein
MNKEDGFVHQTGWFASQWSQSNEQLWIVSNHYYS